MDWKPPIHHVHGCLPTLYTRLNHREPNWSSIYSFPIGNAISWSFHELMFTATLKVSQAWRLENLLFTIIILVLKWQNYYLHASKDMQSNALYPFSSFTNISQENVSPNSFYICNFYNASFSEMFCFECLMSKESLISEKINCWCTFNLF